MMEEHTRDYCCKRIRLLAYLKKKGLKPAYWMPDKDNPAMNVWFFTRTPELTAAIDEYFENMKG